jgi:DNA primase
LFEAGLFPKGIILPYELDPDEFIEQHGTAALKHQIEKAHDLYDLIVEEEVRTHTGEPSEKVQILDRLAPLLQSVRDPRLVALYIQNTAAYLSVDQKLVHQSLRNPAGPRETASKSDEKEEDAQRVGKNYIPHEIIEIVSPHRVELDLLNLALMKEPYFKQVLDSKIIPKIDNPGVRKALETAAEAYGQSICKFDNLTTLLVSRVKPAEWVTLQLVEPLRSTNEETARKLVHDCIRRIEENHNKRELRALMSDMRGAQGENRTEKMEQFMNMQRTRRQLDEEK